MPMLCLNGAYLLQKEEKLIYFTFWKQLRMIKFFSGIRNVGTLWSESMETLYFPNAAAMTILACSNVVCREEG